MPDQQNIKTTSKSEIEDYIKSINEKPFRAKQIYEWIWNKNAQSFDDMTNISKSLRSKLIEKYFFQSVFIHSFQKSKDRTIKYAFELHDKLLIEGVLIPSKSRITACISSQVGCGLNCGFCATGKMGFTRNLTAAEIYEHTFILNQESEKEFDRKLTNIVIMGMGEPLQNYENVLAAINKITTKVGLAMSPQRITLSTAGIVHKIRKLGDDNIKFNLAVSLHTANEEKRTKIMPVNKSNNLFNLTEALKYYHSKTNNRITIEYLLLKNINDALKDAEELATFCKNFPVKINLIQYNETDKDSIYKKSLQLNFDRFKEYLEKLNIIVNTRKSRGDDIKAACGQLISTNKLLK